MDEEKIKAEVNGKTVPKRHFGNHNALPKKKGSITKNTKITREILANALAGQEVNVKDALEQLAQKNPEAYINAIAKLLNNISLDDLRAKMRSLEDDAEEVEFEDLD
jgi:mannitol/fructose-specific phosphotransferase system IIA component (Ntr-type)